MSISIGSPLSQVISNKRRLGALKSLGIVTVEDLLTYYPFRVTDPVPVKTLDQAEFNVKMASVVRVEWARVVPNNAKRGYRFEALVGDINNPFSRAKLTFFTYKKQYANWLATKIVPQSQIVISGKPSAFNNQLQFTHPDVLTIAPEGQEGVMGYDAYSSEEALKRVCSPRPVYHASSRISSEHIHETVLGILDELHIKHGVSREMFLGMSEPQAQAIAQTLNIAEETENHFAPEIAQNSSEFQQQTANEINTQQTEKDENNSAQDETNKGSVLADIIPEPIRERYNLLHREQAFANVHDPQSVKLYNKGIETLKFEEAFVCQTALVQSRQHTKQDEARNCSETSLRDRFIESLPFQLTAGQQSVIDEISRDMSQTHPMQRLLQGEVGSGKTVVALAAMLQATASGGQCVLVAPTQVLAEQHVQSIQQMLNAFGQTFVEKTTSETGGEFNSSADENTGGNVDAKAGNSAEKDGISDNSTASQYKEKITVPPVILLTGGMKLKERRIALAAAASGDPCIVVATHAAFSKSFQAPNLSLVVIDEQHRFGVEQRESLRHRAELSPHMLVMTATPIPRTAAMTWFGDLDISWLTELPGGRKPIRTHIINEYDAATMVSLFKHLSTRVAAGERVYIVCTRIDDTPDDEDENSSDHSEDELVSPYETPYETADNVTDGDTGSDEPTALPPAHSVEEISNRLRALPQLRGIGIATLTGRDDDETKQRVMSEFADGTTPILVSTTVIEVGVDVPQASCIVIFDADRFGLSQLHQLRGRVGRGGTQSWAFLVTRSAQDSLAADRLQVVASTLDGAKIAEEDLRLRGAGDVLGSMQSGGKSSLKLLHVVKDAKLIVTARELAQELLSKDDRLTQYPQLAGAVLDFIRGNEMYLGSD